MATIELVRHGQASLTGDDYDQLSPLGAEQGRAVGRWWAGRGLAPKQVWSGSLNRQADTAAAALGELPGAPARPRIDADFNEYSHHDLFAHTLAQLADPAAMGAHLRSVPHARREFHALFSQALDAWVLRGAKSEGGQSWAEFRARCVGALERVAAGCGRGETVAVFTSGGAIAAICQHLLGADDARVADLHGAVMNASVTRLLCSPGRITLAGFNQVAHLEPPLAPPGLLSYR